MSEDRGDVEKGRWRWWLAAPLLPLLLWAGVLLAEPFDSQSGGVAVNLLQALWRDGPAHFRAFRDRRVRRLSTLEPTGQGSHAGCPIKYRRPSVEEVHELSVRPWLFNSARPLACVGSSCAPPSETEAAFEDYCSARGAGPMCPERGDELLRKLIRRGVHEPLTATPCDAWPHMVGRTTWLFGDSQTLDLYKAMLCTFRDFRDPDTGPVAPPEYLRDEFAPFGIGRPVSANTTQVAYFREHKPTVVEPSCVHLLDRTRVCYLRYDKMEQMGEQLNELSRLVEERDISIVNFGLHHGASTLILGLEKLLLRIRKTPLGTNLYFKDTPPQHFDTLTGGYPMGHKPPFTCKPLFGLKLKSDGTLRLRGGRGQNSAASLYVKANQRNLVTLPVVSKLHIPIIHTYNVSAVLHDFHRDNGAGHECSHFCYPVPGLWVHSLFKTLAASPPGMDIQRS